MVAVAGAEAREEAMNVTHLPGALVILAAGLAVGVLIGWAL